MKKARKKQLVKNSAYKKAQNLQREPKKGKQNAKQQFKHTQNKSEQNAQKMHMHNHISHTTLFFVFFFHGCAFYVRYLCVLFVYFVVIVAAFSQGNAQRMKNNRKKKQTNAKAKTRTSLIAFVCFLFAFLFFFVHVCCIVCVFFFICLVDKCFFPPFICIFCAFQRFPCDLFLRFLCISFSIGFAFCLAFLFFLLCHQN